VATLPITPLETALATSFSDEALEALRARFLYAVTSDHIVAASVRAAVQMAYETELSAALSKRIALYPGIADELVATRRKFLAIDQDMASFRFLSAPALTAALTLDILPGSYMRFLEGYIQAPDPRYRMCGLAVLLCYAAAFFGDL